MAAQLAVGALLNSERVAALRRLDRLESRSAAKNGRPTRLQNVLGSNLKNPLASGAGSGRGYRRRSASGKAIELSVHRLQFFHQAREMKLARRRFLALDGEPAAGLEDTLIHFIQGVEPLTVEDRH